MPINDIKTLEDAKKQIITLWGAITTFQNQLFSIAGEVQETQSLIKDVTSDIRDLITLTQEIKKMKNGEDNAVLEITDEINKYRVEVNKE